MACLQGTGDGSQITPHRPNSSTLGIREVISGVHKRRVIRGVVTRGVRIRRVNRGVIRGVRIRGVAIGGVHWVRWGYSVWAAALLHGGEGGLGAIGRVVILKSEKVVIQLNDQGVSSPGPATRLFIRQLVRANNKENIRSPHYCSFVRGILWSPKDSPHKDPMISQSFSMPWRRGDRRRLRPLTS